MINVFDLFGNPHGRQNSYSRAAGNAVDEARWQVANLVNTYPQRIVFTSGATESCNLALRGVARASVSDRRKLVTLATEHAAVLDTVRDLVEEGFELEILPVDSDGIVDLNRVERAVDSRTLIVSVMAVNNEIGVLQPLPEIASICQKNGVIFHTDATQAPARVLVDVEAWGVDLMSFSSHKIYGPKGVGALYLARDDFVQPVTTGGGQEHGIRSGTVPTTLVCGFGVAADLALAEQSSDSERMTTLAASLRAGIDAMPIEVHHFGSSEARAPGILNFGFRGIPGDKLVSLVQNDIAISTGSACASNNGEVSHVLAALGSSLQTAITGVRVGMGRFTEESHIDVALEALRRSVDTLRPNQS